MSLLESRLGADYDLTVIGLVRGGKTVTLVHDLQLTEADLKALAKQLKAACGTGGSAKDGEIVIQGDHREAIAAALQGLGYKTKFTGG